MSSSSLPGFTRLGASAAALALGLALGACDYHHSHGFFPPPVTIPVPNSVTIADVNGDGAPDLLVATTADQGFPENPGYANVILNSVSSPGSFSTGVAYSTTSSNPSSIAVADLTGTGSLDLVVANFSRGSVALLMHGATPAPSRTPSSYPPEARPTRWWSQTSTATASRTSYSRICPPAAASSCCCRMRRMPGNFWRR